MSFSHEDICHHSRQVSQWWCSFFAISKCDNKKKTPTLTGHSMRGNVNKIFYYCRHPFSRSWNAAEHHNGRGAISRRNWGVKKMGSKMRKYFFDVRGQRSEWTTGLKGCGMETEHMRDWSRVCMHTYHLAQVQVLSTRKPCLIKWPVNEPQPAWNFTAQSLKTQEKEAVHVKIIFF